MSKKNKSEKNQKRPRKTITSYEKQVSVPKGTELTITIDKGHIEISDSNGKPLDVGTETMFRYYQGESRKKVIAWADNLTYTTFEIGAWVINYDYIFAIDTNSPRNNGCLTKFGDFFHAVGFACFAEIQKESDYSGKIIGKPYMVIDWYFTDDNRKMEIESWKGLIDHLQEVIPEDKKVGIVVDSELGLLSRYNNKDMPVIDDWYLPDNYCFIYATADKPDEWCNQLIRACDSNASKRLDEIKNEPILQKNPENLPITYGNISYLDEISVAD